MADAPSRRLKVTLGSQVKTLPLEWWEPGLVLRAAINLIAAREGKGKSSCAASWAARETLSGGTVLWIGTEESREHAQAPRLQAADADMNRVIFVDVEVTTTSGEINSALQLPLDLQLIKDLITEHKVKMIVIDPCKGVVPPDFQGNNEIAVRQFLEPIAALAVAQDVVILGLVHFGKRETADTGKLILGSSAWSQVARTVLSIADDPDTGNRILTNTKSNYTASARSLEFCIVSKTIATSTGVETDFGVVEWIGDTDKDARDLLSEEHRPTEDEFDTKDYTDDLKQSWLYQYLDAAQKADHEVRPKEAVAYGSERGQSRATVFRLFKKLENAGFVKSVDRKEFPLFTCWKINDDVAGKGDEEKPENGDPDSSKGVSRGDGETAETTGLDQAKQDETAVVSHTPDETAGETTAETSSDQEKQEQETPVVSVVSPDLTCDGEFSPQPVADIVDLDSRRSPENAGKKLTAREWLANRIAELQNAGHTTVKSVAVFEAARAAGFNDDNVRIQASKHPDITVIDCKGGIATWSLVPGAQPRPKLRPAAEWFDSWLDQQTSDQVRPQDVRTAAQAAGYAWMTIRKAACASPRIRSVPARGEAVSERIWIIKAAQDEGTAS